MLKQAAYDLDELHRATGAVGKRLSDIDAAEGAAGNISVCVRGPLELNGQLPLEEEIALPRPVPELAGAVFLS